jgi:hypothetical protein
MMQRDKWYEDSETDYVNVSSEALKKRVNDYSYYLGYLLEERIIESDNYFIVGKKSKGYKIADEYMQQGFVPYVLTARKYTGQPPAKKAAGERLQHEYGHLTRWFNHRLQIDYKAASDHLETMYETEVAAHGDARKAMRRYYLRRIALDRFANQEWGLSVDETSRRFHSALTRLKSELRRFIKYDGQPLSAVDVGNSQPFISTMLFNPEFYGTEENELNLYNLDRSLYKGLQKYIDKILFLLSSLNSIIMLVKPDASEANNDVELYCTLVDRAKLYEYISEEYAFHTGKELDPEKPQDYKKLKQSVFLTMYSDNRFINHPRAEMKRIFQITFPTVYNLFSLIKKGDKTRLPVILQTLESEVILRRVTKMLSAAHPELPLFTIHDSVVTLHAHAQLVYDRLKMEFHGTMGLEPRLEYEPWS